MMKQLTAAALALGPTAACLAHEGHGLPGSHHWHASDSLLWLGAAAVAVLLWLAVRRR